jgi:chromosome segregation protein
LRPLTSLASLPASRLVSVRDLVGAKGTDAATESLLDRLLAETYLVESLDAALMLGAGPLAGRPGVRFVTRRGEVLDRLGRTDAGPAGAEQGVGLIRHHAELAELETGLAAITTRLDTERAALERLDASAASVQEQRDRVSGEIAEHRRALAGEQAKADRLRSDTDRLERDASAVRSEIERAAGRHEKLQATRTDKLGRVESLEGLIVEHRDSAETLGKDLADLQTRAEAASEQMSAAREDAGRANAQLDAAKREVGRLERALDDARHSRSEHERHADQARTRLEEHERTVEQTAGDLTAAEASLAEANSGLGSQRGAVEEAAGERTRVAETLHASRERARLVERDWHGVEASRRELEVKRESIEERTGEDLRIDLGAEHLEYRAVMAPGDVERVDIPDAQARINVLRGEIKKLGNVNLDSIAEEGQLAEADEELRRPDRGPRRGPRTLSELIDRLNTASRERFGEVFELIRENFGGQNGMFRRLFGGGRAEVRLMGLVKEVEDADGTVRKVVTDETDLLESGVEVIAKPPGKEPRSISQLSGGEKTLTAVALLMAIFRSKPSCFCVLDEVDAALDEANVGRFCDTVRAFTDMSSRFIVITHNKRTMQPRGPSLRHHAAGARRVEAGQRSVRSCLERRVVRREEGSGGWRGGG